MKLQKKIESKLDGTIKYIFKVENQIVEFSYIDNGSGKDIICVPCQTMCNMSCKFCHLTDHIGKIPLKNLMSEQIVLGVRTIVKERSLGKRPLLISYMGCGEPLDNMDTVFDSMCTLYDAYDNIRFGMATMLPKSRWTKFFELTKKVKKIGINLKVHLSLHFVNDTNRLEWMPAALNVGASIAALNFYKHLTGNKTEVHYTIMDGINDSEADINQLSQMIERGTTIKFMRYSEKESIEAKATSIKLIEQHMEFLQKEQHIVEYYEPPGMDIGASCGQFLLDL